MPEPKKLPDIVTEWMLTNGYDGLWCDAVPCGCLLGDLMPCDEPSPVCAAGYIGRPGPDDEDDCQWCVYGEKQQERDEFRRRFLPAPWGEADNA